MGGDSRMTRKALFIVRAEVPDPADRQPFDEWYRTQHFPLVVANVGSERAWRSWSTVNPAVHYAFYQFKDAPTAESASKSDFIKSMIEIFDDAWGSRVTRTRDVAETVQASKIPIMILMKSASTLQDIE